MRIHPNGKIGMPPLWLWGAFAFAQIPASRVFDRYFPSPMLTIPAAIAILAMILAVIWNWRDSRLLRSPFPTVAFVMVATIAVTFVYPIADGMKTAGGGSDQDDAIIAAGHNLLMGLNPYLTKTYLNNPLSPAPGWVLLHLPFVTAGIYQYTSLFLLTATAVLLRWRSGNWGAATLFLTLLSCTPVTWELLAVGSDLPAVGCLVVMAVVSAEAGRFWPACLMGTLVASSRIIFLFLPGVLGAVLLSRGYRRAVTVAAVTLVGAAALDGAFYLWSPPDFSPFHLLTKGNSLLEGPWKVVAAVLSVGIFAVVLRWRPATLHGQLLGLFACMAVPLGLIALAALWRWTHWHPGLWDGASYLMPTLPPLAAAVAVRAWPAGCGRA